MSSSVQVGQRLSFLSSLCTVRYVGPVEGTKGSWLGVEWDDPSAGKHSGEHNGTRYFECLSKSPTSASFIRPSRPTDPALSFLQAVHKKYASSPTDVTADSTVDEPIEISGKVVEEVGFDKIREQQAALQDLKIVLVDGLGVAGIGSTKWDKESVGGEEWCKTVDEITQTCGSIIELDLSRSLLVDWVDVVGVCKALPRLTVLTINGNRFRDLSTIGLDAEYVHTAFEGVIELSLDETILSWEEIVTLAAMFPDLEILSLASNALTGVHSPLSNPKLRSLSFLSNEITTMTSLNLLSSLSNLRILNLRHNQISTLTEAGPFPTITTLDLSLNSINSLSSLSALPHSFPALTALRTSLNPFTRSLAPETAHMLSLARIPGLTSLNHTRITTKERTNAELYYLSQIAKELGSTDGTIEQETAALSLHPRWKTLCEIHGEPTIVRKEVGSASTDPNSLAGRLVTLTLQLHLEARKSSTNTTLTVPRTVSVYRLKSLIGTKVSVLPSRLKLIWETGEWDPVGRKVKGKRARGWVANDESSEEDEDDDRFSVGESDDENDENGRVEDLEGEGMGSWVKREVELEDGSRVLGSWVEGKEAVVRVETRRI